MDLRGEHDYLPRPMVWIATYSSPRKEMATAEWLASQGEEVCCPTAKSFVRRRIRKSENYAVSEVQAPVFPCYVFAKVSSLIYGLIRNPPLKVGRLHIVSSARVPIEVPDKVIGDIAELYAGGMVLSPEGIRPGAMVRLALAAGMMVEVASTDRLEKYREITVWLDMLGLRRQSNYPLELISAA